MSGDSSLTILTSIKHYRIPYGVIDYKEGGDVSLLREKPEYTLNINTGVYIVNKRILSCIPDKVKFDMTDFINLLLGRGERVLFYPVNEDDFIDIGEWSEYKKSINQLEKLL